MKLRNLNGAIRKFEGAPTVGVMTPLGYIQVPVQKTGLLDALKTLSEDAQVETHMEISDDGKLTVTEEGRAIVERLLDAPVVAQPAALNLLDDEPDTIDLEEAIAATPVDLLADSAPAPAAALDLLA